MKIKRDVLPIKEVKTYFDTLSKELKLEWLNNGGPTPEQKKEIILMIKTKKEVMINCDQPPEQPEVEKQKEENTDVKEGEVANGAA